MIGNAFARAVHWLVGAWLVIEYAHYERKRKARGIR